MNYKTTRNQYFIDQSNFFKVLSSPIRLQILHFISFAPRTVEECAVKFSQSVQNMSLHLISLQRAEILEVLKVKNFRYYYLASGEKRSLVFKALNIDSTSLIPEIHLWNLGAGELMSEINSGQTVIVDLRSMEEINYIPIDNAISYQDKIESLPVFLRTKTQFKKFVLICKGRMCERLADSVSVCLKEDLDVMALTLSSDELSHYFIN